MKYGMLIDLDRCVGCGACVIGCKQENGTTSGIYWCNVYTKEVGQYPSSKVSFLPSACMHCDNAPCVKACPTKATYQREDGIVSINFDKCIGCRACINACPYNARHYNFVDPKKKPYYESFGQTPFEEVKSRNHKVGKTEKCTFCTDRLEQGKEPACVQTCITNARIFGDLDDPDSKLVKAINAKNARSLNPHIGTKPSVYYNGLF